MYKLFNAITSSTATASRRKEMDLRSRTDLRQLLLVHYIQDPTSGGFLNYAFQEMTTQEALFSVEGKTVTTASRDGAGTVTVTCTGHGLEPGDLAVLTGVAYTGAVDFNGSYPVVTTADADTFTYTQIGVADATGAGGRAHRVKRVTFVPEGYNVKSSAQAAGYMSRLGNLPNAVMEFIVSPTDGTHTIYVDELCGGASGSESGAAGDDFVATPVLSAGPAVFAAGDCVGALITLTSITRANGKQVILQNVLVSDKALQSKGLDLIFFNANPSGSTFTDNAPMNVVDADVVKIAAVVHIYASDYVSLTAGSVGQSTERGIAITPADGSRNLWLAVRAAQAITPGYTTGDLQVTLNLLRD